MLQKIKQSLLHHVRHLITLQRRTDQDHRPHGRYHVIRCSCFLESQRINLIIVDRSKLFRKVYKRTKMHREELTDIARRGVAYSQK